MKIQVLVSRNVGKWKSDIVSISSVLNLERITDISPGPAETKNLYAYNSTPARRQLHVVLSPES